MTFSAEIYIVEERDQACVLSFPYLFTYLYQVALQQLNGNTIL